MSNNDGRHTNSTNNTASSVQSPLANGDNNLNSVEEQQRSADNVGTNETNARELTQTDRLNNILLRSFLEKLNQPNSGFPQTVRFDTEENNEEDGFYN